MLSACCRALYQNYQSAGGGAASSPFGRRLSRQSSTGTGDGNKQQQDLVKTANLLFGALEPHYVWDYMKVSQSDSDWISLQLDTYTTRWAVMMCTVCLRIIAISARRQYRSTRSGLNGTGGGRGWVTPGRVSSGEA